MSKNININIKERKRVTAWDFLLIGFFIFAAVIIGVVQMSGGEENLRVVVRKDSDIIYSKSLSDIKSPIEICADEEYNVKVLLMSDGAEIVHSECVDRICVNTGKITHSGQAAVCLPAHVSVALKGGEVSDIDVMVG